MKHVYRLLNPIKSYDWGSHTAIAELLRRQAPTLQPQAELWIGAHPLGKSVAVTEMGEIPLDRLIKQEASALVGRKASRVFRKRLPFLFKVLAAERPLSLQVHPNQEQAVAGFKRDEAAGIARDAPHRRYADPYAKPEILCALTPFHLLQGFRSPEETLEDLETLGLTDSAEQALLDRHLPASTRTLRTASPTAVAGLFLALIRTEGEAREQLAQHIAEAARRATEDPRLGGAARWSQRLAAQYPDDPSILAPFLLNLVELQPGEAVFTDAGILHSYLGGTGIELMGASDNVLRGGLTSKMVDPDELGSLLVLESSSVEVLQPEPSAQGIQLFETDTLDFRLGLLEIDEAGYESSDQRTLEILLCVEGEIRFQNPDRKLTLRSGQALLVGAGAENYRLTGKGRLFVATIGDLSGVQVDDELPWQRSLPTSPEAAEGSVDDEEEPVEELTSPSDGAPS